MYAALSSAYYGYRIDATNHEDTERTMTKTTKADALEQLSELRKGSASGTSKYHPTFEELEEKLEGEDDAIVLEEIDGDDITQTEVGGLRNYLNRHASQPITVRSHRMDDEGKKYRVVAFLAPSDE